MTEPLDSVVLADGSPVTIRPLAAGDRVSVEALFDSISEEHLYTRLFTLGRAVVGNHLDHLFADGPDVRTYVI